MSGTINFERLNGETSQLYIKSLDCTTEGSPVITVQDLVSRNLEMTIDDWKFLVQTLFRT